MMERTDAIPEGDKVALYGEDVETILNGLQEMTTRIAIASGVEPETFAAGVKHHWDFFADAINATEDGSTEPN